MVLKKSRFFSAKFLSILLIIGLIALFIVKSDLYIKTTYKGVMLWGATVVPSLLPFFFLTALLTKSGMVTKTMKLNKISRFLYNAQGVSLYIRLMSLLSGYPVGAKIISDLHKNGAISSAQAEKYCTFTSTSGPLFIIGAVAIGMYQNKTYGYIMLLSHLLSSMLVGVIFRKLPDNGPIAPLFNDKDYDAILYESIYSAVISVLIVGGFIAVFYTFSEMADNLKLLLPLQKFLSLFLGEDLANATAVGLIECTKGAMMLSTCSKGKLSAALSSAIISFGGLSVWFQSYCYLQKAGVRFWIFALSKILHTLICFLICYTLLYFL